MTLEERRAAIEQPALRTERRFEEGLVQRILDAISDAPGDLPLLEFALTELWARQSSDGVLTHAAYEEIGEVRGAIAKHADQTLASLDPDQVRSVQGVFTRLVQVAGPEQAAADARRRVDLAELTPYTRELVQKLTDARLLVMGRDVGSGEETVEVAHEALIRNWKQLHEWLSSDREFLLWRQQLRTMAGIWEESGRNEGALLRDALLREAQVRAAGRTADLSPLEQAYIADSEVAAERAVQAEEAARERELAQARQLAEVERQRAAQARKTTTVLRLLVVILGILALVLPAFLIWQEIVKAQARGPVACFDRSGAVLGSADDPSNESDDYPVTMIPDVPAFCIERYEVTNREYSLCVTARACSPPLNRRRYADIARAEHPVTNVTAYQAEDFCRWLGRRLPSELEWERAARGAEGRPWPWLDGNLPDATRANLAIEIDGKIDPKQSRGDTAQVGSYLVGATPEGVNDLVGNVWEWTANPFRPYPYQLDTRRIWMLSDLRSTETVVQRGGAYSLTSTAFPRVSVRVSVQPDQSGADVGFRCAVSAR